MEHLNHAGYDVVIPKILNSKDFGLPQNRERIYIVGFRKDLKIKGFSYPISNNNKKKFIDVKEKGNVDLKYL